LENSPVLYVSGHSCNNLEASNFTRGKILLITHTNGNRESLIWTSGIQKPTNYWNYPNTWKLLNLSYPNTCIYVHSIPYYQGIKVQWVFLSQD